MLGPVLRLPESLACGGGAAGELTEAHFERLLREEIVHSVLRLAGFKTAPDANKGDTTFRITETLGFSGPIEGKEPSLTPELPDATAARILVLDDTGNRFRRDTAQWLNLLKTLPPDSLIVHKLHRNLPLAIADGSFPDNALWDQLQQLDLDRQVVVLDVADLRKAGAFISHRLSWERAAVELVSQLRTVTAFKTLAACRWLIVRFGLDGALLWHQPVESNPTEPLAWLVYDPQRLEDGFAGTRSGTMVGYGSAFVAGLTAKLASASVRPAAKAGQPPTCLIEGIKLGLTAARRLLNVGFGPKPKFDQELNPRYPAELLFLPKEQTAQMPKEAQTDAFHCLGVPVRAKEWADWTILKSLLPGGHALEAAAQGLAIKDRPPSSLQSVPLAVFGKYSTYDRDDAEAYQSISNLIREYLHTGTPKRPLSLAIFGPPGSGKSFGVKEVAESIAEGEFKLEKIVLNLAQLTSPDELAVQLHLVRDAVLRGKVPLVFFDEFDASVGGTPLYWLKFLLAPMQDGEFLEHGSNHPIGKSIFVFAGGTCDSFEVFTREPNEKDEKSQAAKVEERKRAKLNDFISRLRGYLNIRGVDHREGYRGPALLRRASVLRFQLKEKHPSLFAADGTLNISPDVLRAFLHVPRFSHGVRSLEAIIDMSQLSDRTQFAAAFLPSAAQLSLHVVATTEAMKDRTGPGFLDLVARAYPWPIDVREKLAREIHRRYLPPIEKRIPGKPAHQEWEHLPEYLCDSNREQADDIPRKLLLMKLDHRPCGTGLTSNAVRNLRISDYRSAVDVAAKDEHDRWYAERRRKGWEFSESEDLVKCTHPDMVPWDQLPEFSKDKDRAAIYCLPEVLAAGSQEIFDPNFE